MMDLKRDRLNAAKWAADLMRSGNFLVIDTETTGLDVNLSEIVEISVVSGTGEILLNTRVCPTAEGLSQLVTKNRRGISAYDIHGIGPEQLRGEPSFVDVYAALQDIVRGQQVVIYNAGYDWPLLQSLCRRNGLPELEALEYPACAMLRYAEFYGAWDDYHQSYTWQRLEGGDHSALGDCLATLKVMRLMAEELLSSEAQEGASVKHEP